MNKMVNIVKTRLKKILVVLAIVETLFVRSSNTNVQVKLMTNPVIFGENVTLTCMIQENSETKCYRRNRIWHGGRLNNVLLINGNSVDKEKYEEVIDDSCKKFSIVIKTFDVTDVKSYRCSYGSESSSKDLQLEKDLFIAKPHQNTTKVVISKDTAHFNVTVDIVKVYPIPMCSIQFEGRSNSLKITKVSETGMFNNVRLEQRYRFPERCTGCGEDLFLSLTCSLGKITVVEYIKTINCTVNFTSKIEKSCVHNETQTDSFSPVFIIGVPIVTAALLVIAVVYCWLCWLYWRKKNTKRKKTRTTVRYPKDKVEMGLLTDPHKTS